MEPRTLKYITAACAGELRQGAPETWVTGVATDSRQARVGDVFFAIAGERFDGHAFLAETAGQGVAGVVIERAKLPAAPPECAVIIVEDTRRALGRLAAAYRADFAALRIAVAGSNGKTTTKELLGAVLSEGMPTLWNDASFNNDIGVPLTLLRLASEHRAVVCEVGTNHPGELAPLARLCAPRFGVVTNIGREHLEFFGDLAGVASEEGELPAALPADGRFFVNGDDPWSDQLAARGPAAVVRVGFGERNDWQATEVRADALGADFKVRAPRGDLSGAYRLNLLGRHQVGNALLAMAVAGELGLSAAEIRRGLAGCQPAKMRMQSWQWHGVRVLDDAYNANADSMLAALATLQDIPCAGRRVAVLGDMAELGIQSPAAHAEVGRRAAGAGVDRLLAVGRMAGVVARAARDAGLREVTEFAEPGEAAAELKDFLRAGDVLLLKASRSSRLERLTQALRE